MGKWDFLREKFAQVPIEATYQVKIDAVLDSKAYPACSNDATRIRDLDDQKIKDRYVAARARMDELTAEEKVLGLEIEAYTRLFAVRMEDNGEASKTFDDGVSIGVSIEPYPIVVDKEALLAWVKERGLEAMLTLNYQTLASMIKERLEGKVNEPLPPGTDVFLKNKLTCRGRG